MLFALILLGSSQETTTSHVTESIIFHPIEQIQTSKNSWITSTAIDFQPYSNALSNIRHYAISVRDSAHKFFKSSSFDDKDLRYKKLINMTKHDIDSAIEKLDDAYTAYSNLFGVMCNGIMSNYESIAKRSLLPLGGILSFLCGTADQHGVNAIKKDVKALYENQMRQSAVVDDVYP